jgi:hypothetical protein
MSLDVLVLLRNLLLKAAIICFGLAWLATIATIALWDVWTKMLSEWYRMNPADFGPLMGNWFALIKFYFLFVLLAPALALHWEIKKREKHTAES